jgi:hypothetical protein
MITKSRDSRAGDRVGAGIMIGVMASLLSLASCAGVPQGAGAGVAAAGDTGAAAGGAPNAARGGTGARGGVTVAAGIPVDPPRGDYRVAVISDLNSAYGSTAYGREVVAGIRMIREVWKPDLVLVAGDMIAGQRPSLTDENVRAMWAAFDSVVAAPLRAAGIPLGFTLGNHDASAHPSHGRDRAFAVEHWRAPGRHPGVTFVDSTHFPIYFSYRQGPLFVVSWDASWHGVHTDTAMLAWVARQLGSAASAASPVRLVLGHLPLYAVAEGRNRAGEVLAEADSLRALLERFGVHTYISGHHHAYYPGRRGALELLASGALGDGPRPYIGDTVPTPRTVTLMDFHPLELGVRYTTYTVAGMTVTGVVREETLPPRLDGLNGWVELRGGGAR